MAKYFIDTEFIEDGFTIDLISIAIVSEDNRELYYVSNEFDPSKANQWVIDNVLSKLPKAPYGMKIKTPLYNLFNLKHKVWQPKTVSTIYPHCSYIEKQESLRWISKESIAHRILSFIGIDASPEFWGACSAYDWVILCQLYGKMINTPKHFPYYCNDIIALADYLGISRDQLPKDSEDEYTALANAKWVRDAYKVVNNIYLNRISS